MLDKLLDNKTQPSTNMQLSLSASLLVCLSPTHSPLCEERVSELGLSERGGALEAEGGGGACVPGGVNSLNQGVRG